MSIVRRLVERNNLNLIALLERKQMRIGSNVVSQGTHDTPGL